MLNNLKSKYEKLEEQPSDLLWDKLEAQLNQNTSSLDITPTRKDIFEKKWSRYAAVAVLLLTLGNVIWMLTPKEKEQNIIVKEIIKTEKIPSNIDNGKLSDIAAISTENIPLEHSNFSPKNEQPKTVLESGDKNSPIILPPTLAINKKEELLVVEPKKDIVEKTKYISASDLLFGAEIDKSRKEQASPNSKLGLNDIKHHPKDPNNFSPKSLKIFGITVYESDSLTQK